MADIFDTLTPKPEGDVFDQVAPPAAEEKGGDIFDQLAPPAPYTDPSPGLQFQSKGPAAMPSGPMLADEGTPAPAGPPVARTQGRMPLPSIGQMVGPAFSMADQGMRQTFGISPKQEIQQAAEFGKALYEAPKEYLTAKGTVPAAPDKSRLEIGKEWVGMMANYVGNFVKDPSLATFSLDDPKSGYDADVDRLASQAFSTPLGTPVETAQTAFVAYIYGKLGWEGLKDIRNWYRTYGTNPARNYAADLAQQVRKGDLSMEEATRRAAASGQVQDFRKALKPKQMDAFKKVLYETYVKGKTPDPATVERNTQKVAGLIEAESAALAPRPPAAPAPVPMRPPVTAAPVPMARPAAQPVSQPVSEVGDYRGEHGAPDQDSAPAYDLTGNEVYPKDVYDRPDWYETDSGLQEMRKIQRLKGNPDAPVWIHRAVPKSAAGPLEGRVTRLIRPGDWVTTNKQYAKEHGEAALNGDYVIVSRRVTAKDIHTNGDSIFEWGYNPIAKAAQPPAQMPANAPGLPQAAPQAPGRGAVAPAGEKAVAGATGAGMGKQASGEAALLAEARKYDSPEEFIGTMGRPVYHGSYEIIDKFINLFKGSNTNAFSAHKAFWFSESPKTAEEYSVMTIARDIENDLKKEFSDTYEKIEAAKKEGDWYLVDELRQEIDELRAERINNLQTKTTTAYLTGDFYEWDAKGKHPSLFAFNTILDEARDEGYAGVKFTNLQDTPGHITDISTHYAVFSPENIQTKTQLTALWRKAHTAGKPVPSEVLAEYLDLAKPAAKPERGLPGAGEGARAVERPLTAAETFGEEAPPSWEGSKLATDPRISEKRLVARKLDNGRYGLYYKDSGEEVFREHTFSSAPTARKYFRDQKELARADWEDRQAEKERSAELQEAEQGLGTPVLTWLRRRPPMHMGREGLDGELRLAKEEGLGSIIRAKRDPYKTTESIEHTLAAAVEQGYYEPGTSLSEFIEDVISNKRGERTTYPAFEGVAAPKGAVGQDEMDLGVDRENVSAAIDRRTKELVSAGAPAPAARQQAIREVAAQQTARTRQAQTPTAQPRQGALDLGHEDLPLFGGATAGAKPITQTEKANERKIKPAIRKLRTHLDRLRGKANFPGRDTPARKSRLARKLEAEGILFHDQGQIDAHVAAETFIAIRDPNIEQLMVVPTSKGVAPFAQCVSSGLPNATAFASKKGEAPLIRAVRRMNKWIEDYKIDEISIVHNHPGGSPYPSGWDKRDKGLVDDMRFFDYLRSQIPDSVTLNFVVTNGGYTILKWKKAALGLPVTEMSAKYDFKTPAQVYSPAGPVIEGVHHAAYEMIGMQGRKGWAEGVFATLLGPNNDSMGTFFFNERVLRKGNLPRAVGDLVKSRRAKSAIIGGFGLDLESVARGHSFDVAIDGVISISKDLSGYESAGVRGMMPVQAKQQGHPSRLFAEPQDISQDEQRVAPPASPFPATLPSEGAAPQPPPFKRPAPPDREMFEAMPWAVKPLFEMNENDWALVMALNREYLHMSRAQILNSIERMIPKLPGGAGEYETIRKRFFDPTANLDVSQWPTDDLTALALKMEVRTSDTIPPAIREQEAELDKFYDKLGAEKRKNITPRLWFTPFDVYSRQVSPAVTEKVVDPLRQTQRRAAVERQDALGAIGQMRKAVEKAAGIRGPFQQGKARELSTRLYKATEGLKAVGELPSILSQVEQDAIAAHNRDAEELLRAVNAVRELAGERPIKNWTRTGYIRHILKPDIVTAYHEKGALDPELAKIMDKIPKTGLHLGSAQHRLNLSPEMMDALFNQDFWQSWAVMVGEKIRYKNLRLTLEKVKPYIDIMRKHPEFDPNAFRMYDRWLEQNIKYRPGEIDGYLNGLFNGIIGMWNKAAPASMRKAAGTQPWRDVVDFLSQGMHVGALSMRLKPIIRNRIQSFLDWTMMGSQAYTNGRTMYHTKQGRALLNASDVFKSRIFVIGQEAASVKQVFDVMGAGYKWSDKKNVGQSILTAYWRYVNEYGMQEADKLPGGGKYSAAALKRAEQYMMDTQWSYFREDMPKVYWSSTGRLAFGLGSWPMSFWNRYVPEVFRRTFTGKDGRGEPVKGTERWAGLRFLLLLGATYALKEASKEVLGGKREVDYTSSVLPDPRFARPGGFGPGAMAAIGLWEALAGQSKWERERGWRLVKRSAMIHIPGYLGFKDIADVVNGEKDLIDYTFYTRKVKEGKPAPPAAPARRRAPVKRTRYAIYAPAQRAKR